MFVGRDVRPGVLPRMLYELLQTRVRVKAFMQSADHDPELFVTFLFFLFDLDVERSFGFSTFVFFPRKAMLFSRQLGLKLIANVTYGYTSAGFSGRMPVSLLRISSILM